MRGRPRAEAKRIFLNEYGNSFSTFIIKNNNNKDVDDDVSDDANDDDNDKNKKRILSGLPGVVKAGASERRARFPAISHAWEMTLFFSPSFRRGN